MLSLLSAFQVTRHCTVLNSIMFCNKSLEKSNRTSQCTTQTLRERCAQPWPSRTQKGFLLFLILRSLRLSAKSGFDPTSAYNSTWVKFPSLQWFSWLIMAILACENIFAVVQEEGASSLSLLALFGKSLSHAGDLRVMGRAGVLM